MATKQEVFFLNNVLQVKSQSGVTVSRELVS